MKMAKTPNKNTVTENVSAPIPAVPSAPASVGGFAFEQVDVPAMSRAPGGRISPYREPMLALPLPGADGRPYSFFAPVGDVPATITDASEREKEEKELSRKLANSISGLTRKLVEDDAGLAFITRTMRNADGRLGIRVFRVAPQVIVPAAS